MNAYLLLGISDNSWQTIATFTAPSVAGLVIAIVGVRLAGSRLRRELEGQDARHAFLDEGLLKLSNSIQQMLGATRINYALCTQLLRLHRDLPRGHPAAPRPEDMPSLMPSIPDGMAFAAIGPASRICDFAGMGELATYAFSKINLVNLWFLTEIWLPIRGYYADKSAPDSLDRKMAFDRLVPLALAEYNKAEAFGSFPELLNDLALRSMEMGLGGFDDVWRLRKDPEIGRIRVELASLLERMKSAT